MYRIALIILAIAMTSFPKLWWYESYSGHWRLFAKDSPWSSTLGYYALMIGALVVPLVALWLASRKPAHA